MTRKNRMLIREVPPGVDVFNEDAESIPTREEAFDVMVRDEMEREEAKKPPAMTEPADLAAVLLGRLHGLEAAAAPATRRFPVRVGPVEAEIDYRVRVSLQAENRRALADAVDAAIRAGQRDIIAGPVVLYLYAVQGHDKIKANEHGLPYVELTYIFRLRETTPKQEV